MWNLFIDHANSDILTSDRECDCFVNRVSIFHVTIKVSSRQVNGLCLSSPHNPLNRNIASTMIFARPWMRVILIVATNYIAASKARNVGHFYPTGSLLSQLDKDISLSRRVRGPKHRILQANKTATCNDFEAALTQLIGEKIKDPIEMQTLLCGQAARDAFEDASFDLDAYFTNDKYGEYAGCAKSFFNESVINSKSTSALPTDTDACRTEVAVTIRSIKNSTITGGTRRSRKLIIFLVAFGIFAAIMFSALPFALGLAAPAVENAVVRARQACTTSSQCGRNRCCALNLRRDRACLPTPAIRNVRERKCI
jgi:hypothetical protein